MYHKTLKIQFRSNDELDKELDRLAKLGYSAWHYEDTWMREELSFIATIKFKVRDA